MRNLDFGLIQSGKIRAAFEGFGRRRSFFVWTQDVWRTSGPWVSVARFSDARFAVACLLRKVAPSRLLRVLKPCLVVRLFGQSLVGQRSALSGAEKTGSAGKSRGDSNKGQVGAFDVFRANRLGFGKRLSAFCDLMVNGGCLRAGLELVRGNAGSAKPALGGV